MWQTVQWSPDIAYTPPDFLALELGEGYVWVLINTVHESVFSMPLFPSSDRDRHMLRGIPEPFDGEMFLLTHVGFYVTKKYTFGV